MLVFVCLCFPPTTNRPVATATNPLESEVTFKKNVVLIWSFTHSQSVTPTGLLIFINIDFCGTYDHSLRGKQLTFCTQ